MKLVAHMIDGRPIDIRPAPVERDWMDATLDHFAYRCLPLNVANAHGWEILCPAAFSAVWNGNKDVGAVNVRFDDSNAQPCATSHFGQGTLTFRIPCLFQTDAGWDLMAQGPINRPKDGIAPLSGIIETDWAPYTFTMNWIFTRPQMDIRFEKGEPFCHIFPVQRGQLTSVEPEIKALSTIPELEQQFHVWRDSRRKFNSDLGQPGSEANVQGWQKMYYRGLSPDGAPAVEDHVTRLRLKPFKTV